MRTSAQRSISASQQQVPTKHAARDEFGKGFIFCFFSFHKRLTPSYYSVEVQLYNHIGSSQLEALNPHENNG